MRYFYGIISRFYRDVKQQNCGLTMLNPKKELWLIARNPGFTEINRNQAIRIIRPSTLLKRDNFQVKSVKII